MTMIIRIGFSGSREGMTAPQLRAVYRYLTSILAASDWDDSQLEAHHGDCTGGDAQFHVIATVLGARTVAHPPLNSSRRAWCQADEIREPKAYHPRDWDIANETSELIAAPKSPVPVQHSGTWITAGYAVSLGRRTTVFPPDGRASAGSQFFLPPVQAVPR